MYDYREAMTEDVKEWIKENVDLTEWTEDREGLEQQLNDDLWTEDSITGNAKDGFTFERVSKATARRVFNNDMPVMLCPCNLRPETGLFSTVVQNGKHLDTTFETMLNTFEYYNCTTNVTGRYTAFYIPVTEVDRFTGETPTAATLGTVKQYDYNFIN